jgi:UDP-N-acetylglucosamine 2-epimerase (non-hydrolysing)
MKLISVVGARPNFMKIAPFIRAIASYNNRHPEQPLQHLLLHTGQHYDARMSDTFFSELGIPEPDINLEIGSGTHAEQVGHTMMAFEKVLKQEKPDWVIVVGDVNATLACAITAKKEGIKCCHIEAGLRSGDMNMPEEINRLVTDRLSDLLLTPDLISSANLKKEGVQESRIVFTGNIMIDTLEYNRKKAEEQNKESILRDNMLEGQRAKLEKFTGAQAYGLITMHRPSNVDDKYIFTDFCHWIMKEATQALPLLWPIHPRALKQAERFGLLQELLNCGELLLLHPLGYLSMLHLNMHARLMLTDSGGLQEECCVLGTPFLTLRHNTERPVTLVEHGGAGYLTGNAISDLKKEFSKLLSENRTPKRPELWDGQTAERCLNAILNYNA